MKKTCKNLFTSNHFFTFKKPVTNLLPYSPNPLFPSKNAFTLTEVLVALTIVGVISALVLPAVVTRYQEKVFDSAYRRETQVIESAVDELVVSENKTSFFDTMMYKDVEPEDYDDSSKVFVNKYLRASKICATGSDCFAKKYYTYEDNDKKVYTPEFKGTCAKLKNGASICISPQIGGVPIKGIIDINGDKGPNVFGEKYDLRTFEFSVWTRYGKNNEVAEVKDNDFAPIGTTDPCEGMTCGCGDLPECDPCEGLTCGCGSLPACGSGGGSGGGGCSANPSEWDVGCCQSNISSITNSSHHCCSYSSIKNTVAACSLCSHGVRVEGVGCVYVLPSYSAIDTTKEIYKKYDNVCNVAGDSNCHGVETNNYWAGAKFACEQLGMSLSNLNTFGAICNSSFRSQLPNWKWYWTSDQDNSSVGSKYLAYSTLVGPTCGGGTSHGKDNDFKAVCVSE